MKWYNELNSYDKELLLWDYYNATKSRLMDQWDITESEYRDMCKAIESGELIQHTLLVPYFQGAFRVFYTTQISRSKKMTREEIESEYTVRNGVIVSPGKFEGEPIYAPYFYDAMMNGVQDDTTEDDEGNTVDTFFITDDDIEQFPELKNIEAVFLTYYDNGFVTCETV